MQHSSAQGSRSGCAPTGASLLLEAQGSRASALSCPALANLPKAVLEASHSHVYILTKCGSQSICQTNDSIKYPLKCL